MKICNVINNKLMIKNIMYDNIVKIVMTDLYIEPRDIVMLRWPLNIDTTFRGKINSPSCVTLYMYFHVLQM